jgi:hypothetical protein
MPRKGGRGDEVEAMAGSAELGVASARFRGVFAAGES